MTHGAVGVWLLFARHRRAPQHSWS